MCRIHCRQGTLEERWSGQLELKTIGSLDIKGKKALMRVDFNVPLNDEGKVADDSRIKATLPTINYLLEGDARVILMSHLGRPKGKVVEKMRLNDVARRLGELLGKKVNKVDDCIVVIKPRLMP